MTTPTPQRGTGGWWHPSPNGDGTHGWHWAPDEAPAVPAQPTRPLPAAGREQISAHAGPERRAWVRRPILIGLRLGIYGGLLAFAFFAAATQVDGNGRAVLMLGALGVGGLAAFAFWCCAMTTGLRLLVALLRD